MYEDSGQSGTGSDDYTQLFNLGYLRYWIGNLSGLGEQAIHLDDRYAREGFDHGDPATS